MVCWVGVDDTDSMERMCTTYVASEIVARVSHLDLIGYPRLVRLNPNIPWKTRGNGALCLRFGQGRGAPFQVGMVNGTPILAHPRARPTAADEELWEISAEAVVELSDLDDPDTNPGLVITRNPPGPSLYWRAVRDVVDQAELAPSLAEADRYLAPKGPRGLIGALAATSWRPRDKTFEVLAHRRREKWGSERYVEEADVRALDRRFPTTFNNYDPESHHVVLTPNSPCPVLLGIRGDVADDLPKALATLRSEDLDRWLLFETNQGTDEHLIPQTIGNLRPHTSAIVRGVVGSYPVSRPGGHVVFPLTNGGAVDCVAYEPTKSFRRIVSELCPEDELRAYGSVRDKPRSINLEKLEVLRLSDHTVKVANPRCPDCAKSMKSVGKDRGFRCRRCGVRLPFKSAEFRPLGRRIREGFYEPPISARRHLSKPLRRMGGTFLATSAL